MFPTIRRELDITGWTHLHVCFWHVFTAVALDFMKCISWPVALGLAACCCSDTVPAFCGVIAHILL